MNDREHVIDFTRGLMDRIRQYCGIDQEFKIEVKKKTDHVFVLSDLHIEGLEIRLQRTIHGYWSIWVENKKGSYLQTADNLESAVEMTKSIFERFRRGSANEK